MGKKLNVLLIEDLEEDAELTVHALQSCGYDLYYERVETLEAMQNALASKEWSCIISDYSMPHFNGIEALTEFKKSNLEIPFLFVSGTMGEDVAVEAMKAGAHDYVVKGKLSRLVPALERELAECEVRKQKKLTEDALKVSEENFRILFEQASDAIFIAKGDGNFINVNSSGCKLLDYNREELLQMNITDVDLNNHDIIPIRYAELQRGNRLLFDTVMRKKDGSKVQVEISLKMLPEGNIQGIVRDITERKKTIEEISLLAQSLKSINECVSITDLNDKCIFVNNSFLNVYGYSEAEIVGKNISIIRSNKNSPEVINEILPATMKGDWKGEIWNCRKDGSEFLISLRTSIVKDVNGNAIACIGVAEDITKQKKMLDDVRENEQRLKVALSSIDIAVFNQDVNLVYTWMYQSQLGYKSNQVIGKTDSDLLPLEFANEITQIKRLVIENNKGIRKEVQVVWNDRIYYFDLITEPLHNSDGKVIGITGASIDITERKQSEEKIIISEQQFRSVWENSFDAMRLCDENGINRRVNSAFCRLANKTKEELEGSFFDVIYAHTEHDNPVESYRSNFQSRAIMPIIEGEIKLWDNRKIWVEISNSYVEIMGRPTLLLSIFHDITERIQSIEELKSSKEKAEEMSRLKSNFLANMSHELRTPLIGILGYSDILKDELAGSNLAEMAEIIQISGTRLLDTLNMVLNLSRIEADRLPMEYNIFNAIDTVKEILALFKALAEKKGLYLKLNNTIPKIEVNLDQRMFREVINNLVNNALKYTNKGGVTITVYIDHRGNEQWLNLKVIDTGIGIPRESQKYIFDEFRQVSEGFSRSFEGTGLGLTMTKRFVEKMNGNISMDSEPGNGTTFLIAFPVNMSPLNENIQFELHDKADFFIKHPVFKEKHMKTELPDILLVENDNASVEVTKFYLKNIFNVDFVIEGIEAIEAVKSKPYSAILMDINLGKGMSGLEAAKLIREIPNYKDIPIIAFTAFAMKGDKEEFLAAGCSHYLAKPFTKNQLIDIVNEAINSVE